MSALSLVNSSYITLPDVDHRHCVEQVLAIDPNTQDPLSLLAVLSAKHIVLGSQADGGLHERRVSTTSRTAKRTALGSQTDGILYERNVSTTSRSARHTVLGSQAEHGLHEGSVSTTNRSLFPLDAVPDWHSSQLNSKLSAPLMALPTVSKTAVNASQSSSLMALPTVSKTAVNASQSSSLMALPTVSKTTINASQSSSLMALPTVSKTAVNASQSSSLMALPTVSKTTVNASRSSSAVAGDQPSGKNKKGTISQIQADGMTSGEDFDVDGVALRPCDVCGEIANGHYFGAVACLPCKSFFIRCTKGGGAGFSLECGGKCNVQKSGRNRCQFCRLQKCLSAGMYRKEKPEAVVPEEGQVLCHVCKDIANGVHFGVATCEGCKKFFRRGLKEHQTYVCRAFMNCTINPRMRNNCRYCRYQRCLQTGMSKDAIRMGRPKKGESAMARAPFGDTASVVTGCALQEAAGGSQCNGAHEGSFSLEALSDNRYLSDEFLEAVSTNLSHGDLSSPRLQQVPIDTTAAVFTPSPFGSSRGSTFSTVTTVCGDSPGHVPATRPSLASRDTVLVRSQISPGLETSHTAITSGCPFTFLSRLPYPESERPKSGGPWTDSSEEVLIASTACHPLTPPTTPQGHLASPPPCCCTPCNCLSPVSAWGPPMFHAGDCCYLHLLSCIPESEQHLPCLQTEKLDAVQGDFQLRLEMSTSGKTTEHVQPVSVRPNMLQSVIAPRMKWQMIEHQSLGTLSFRESSSLGHPPSLSGSRFHRKEKWSPYSSSQHLNQASDYEQKVEETEEGVFSEDLCELLEALNTKYSGLSRPDPTSRNACINVDKREILNNCDADVLFRHDAKKIQKGLRRQSDSVFDCVPSSKRQKL